MTENEIVALVERLFAETLVVQEVVAQLGEPKTARWPYVVELSPHDDTFEYIEVDVRDRALTGLILQLRSPMAFDLDPWLVRFGPMSRIVHTDRIIRLLMVEPPHRPGAIVLETTRDERVTSICARCSDRASTLEIEAETLELPQVMELPSVPLVADEEEALLPLATYAAIKVSVLRAERPIVEILAEHGLDEVRWCVEERRRAAALSRAAERGDFITVRSVRQALHAARRAAQPAPTERER